MNNNSRSDNEETSKSYLDKVSDGYIFDGASGLYHPKPKRQDKNSSTDTTGRYKRVPFWVSVKTDWLVLSVSVGTLFLLVATVHYARKQWVEANRSASASEISAIAAKSAAETARDALISVQRAFVFARPWSMPIYEPNSNHLKSIQGKNILDSPTQLAYYLVHEDSHEHGT